MLPYRRAARQVRVNSDKDKPPLPHSSAHKLLASLWQRPATRDQLVIVVPTYFEVSVSIDENVLRFQITINDVEVMEILKGKHYLRGIEPRM